MAGQHPLSEAGGRLGLTGRIALKSSPEWPGDDLRDHPTYARVIFVRESRAMSLAG